MGSIFGTVANDAGTDLGNIIAAPFRTLFGGSCESVCSGTWDVGCFIEHLCVSNLARLFMVLVLTYITLFFVYLLYKLGIINCVAKNACKMAWKACSGSCRALGGACCLLWRKLRNTKRVRRGRQLDVEEGELSSSRDDTDSSSSDGDRGNVGAGRARGRSPSVRERRKDRLRRSLRLRRLNSKKGRTTIRSHASGRLHHVSKLRRAEASSVHIHGSVRQHGRARVHRDILYTV